MVSKWDDGYTSTNAVGDGPGLTLESIKRAMQPLIAQREALEAEALALVKDMFGVDADPNMDGPTAIKMLEAMGRMVRWNSRP
jgi:hypothetical protein